MDEKLKKCPYCGKEILEVAKKCRYCGMWIDGDDGHMTTCPSCGERVDKRSKKCPYCCEPLSPASEEDEAQPVAGQPTSDAPEQKPQLPQSPALPAGNDDQGLQVEERTAMSQNVPANEQREDTSVDGTLGSVVQDSLSPASAIQRCFRKYAIFEGRASRAEFWWFTLFCGIVYTLAYVGCLAVLAKGADVSFVYVLASVVSGLLLIPFYAVGTRRLHDTDNSGWYWLIQLVPIIGSLAFLYILCLKSSPDNQYGTKASRYTNDPCEMTNRDKVVVAVVGALMAIGIVCGLSLITGMGKMGSAANENIAAVDSDTISAEEPDTTASVSDESSSGDQVLDLAEQVYKKCYYDRYGDGEDYPTIPFGYQVSPDGKFLFIVTEVQANGSGWMTEYQLQRYNIETGELRFITDCAGIIMGEDGITVAKATATNEETAQSEAELIYQIHDQHYFWNGKADLGGDYEEYSRDHFEQEYSVGEYIYVSGVERFPQSFVNGQ